MDKGTSLNKPMKVKPHTISPNKISLPCTPDNPCWAHRRGGYTFGVWDDKSDVITELQFKLYEAMVEYIEEGHITSAPDLANRFWKWGDSVELEYPGRRTYTYRPGGNDFARNVIVDLARHGLIKCVNRNRRGRCLQWMAIL